MKKAMFVTGGTVGTGLCIAETFAKAGYAVFITSRDEARAQEAAAAVAKLGELRGCQAHSTVILSQVDADIYRKLGMHLTCEPNYQTKKLYHK